MKITAVIGIFLLVSISLSAEERLFEPIVPDELVPAEYQLRPGDEFKIDLIDYPEYSQEVTVDYNGYIYYSYVGKLYVSGKPVSRVAYQLETKLKRVLAHPSVVLKIKKKAKNYLILNGNISLPKKYEFYGSLTLLDLLRDIDFKIEDKYLYKALVSRQPDREFDINLNNLFFSAGKASDVKLEHKDIVTFQKLYPFTEKQSFIDYIPVTTAISRRYKILGIATADLRNDLQQLVSENGRLIVNDKLQVVYIKDYPENVEKVSEVLTLFNEEKKKVRQILIEAKILEVILNKDEVFGIDWYKLTGEESTLTNDMEFSSDYNLNIIQMSNLGSRYEVIMEALKKHGNVNTLATPNIVTVNAQKAYISAGEQVPYKTLSENRGAESTSGYSFKDVYINLEVFPDIISDTLIMLKITPEVSSVSGYTSTEDRQPVINTRKADAVVMLENNESLFLGGILNEKKILTKKKVPILGDFPGLDVLFSKKVVTNVKSELVILLKCSFIDGGSVGRTLAKEKEDGLNERSRQYTEETEKRTFQVFDKD